MHRSHFFLPAIATIVFGVCYFYWQQKVDIPNPHIVQDETIGVDEGCPVHHIKMEKIWVRLRYGDNADAPWYTPKAQFAGGPLNFRKLMSSTFPFACEQAYGGCVIRPAGTAAIYLCPDCVTALHKWQLEMVSSRAPVQK